MKRMALSCKPAPLLRLTWSGFTLLETMLVLVMTVLLLSLAVPSFRNWALKRAVQQAAEALVADLRLARSEAVKRGALVAVCASADGASCASIGTPAGAWADGWLVFVDRNGNRAVDAGDEILRVQTRPDSIFSIASLSPQTDKRIFTYQPTGWAKLVTQTFYVKPSEGAPAELTRLVCVSNQGRPSLRPIGTAQCT